MKKRMYISDLDGTLLSSKKVVPVKAKEKLNFLIRDKDLKFSVATARTPATVEKLLEGIAIDQPLVVMNGAALYNLKSRKYEHIEYIDDQCTRMLLKSCEQEVKEGFIYAITDHKINVYYQDITRPERKKFFDERQNLRGKQFIKGRPEKYEEIVYFVFMDSFEKINGIDEKISRIKGINSVKYKDIYSEDWMLEVYSDQATKANGIKRLKEMGHFDEMICFGDNLNDLPMYAVCDRSYAVANAMPEVKEKATGIIGSCEESSVPFFIEEDLLKNE